MAAHLKSHKDMASKIMTEHQPYRIGYKALTCERMSIISKFDSPLPNYARKYEVLQRVIMQSSCGPLAVFDTLQDAKRFQDVNGSVTFIVSCVYKLYIGKQALWTPVGVFASLPTGTILASEVICLE